MSIETFLSPGTHLCAPHARPRKIRFLISTSARAAFSLAALLMFSSPASAGQRVAVLNGLRLVLDESNGTLLKMEYPGVGVMLEASGERASMLSLAYPTPKFEPLRLESRESQVHITTDDRQVVLRWDRLTPSRRNFDYEGTVSAEVTLSADGDGRSVIWQCRVKNDSKLPIKQVLFPDLRGLRPFDGDTQTALTLAGKIVRPFENPISGPHEVKAYYNVGETSYQPPLAWMDFGSLKGGFSLFAMRWGIGQPAPPILTRRLEADPSALLLYWDNRHDIAPGKSWSSYEFCMTPHTSGWAKGIDVFRAFVARSVPPRPPLPKHVREGLAFWSPWMTESVERDPARAAFRFSDFPAMGKEAVEHGVTEIVPWRWNDYWTQFPYTLRKELGTEEEFYAGVKAIKQVGVNVCPFISIAIARANAAPRYGLPLSGVDWTYHPELIPRIRPGYTTGNATTRVGTANRQWVKDVQDILLSWIDRGICSFSWDGFELLTVERRGLVEIIRPIREKARKVEPESTFSGENWADLEIAGEVLDYTWNWRDYSEDWQTITSVLPWPRQNVSVQTSPLTVKKGFMDNMYLNVMPKKPDMPNGTAWIHEFPELSAALKQCAELRKQFLPYFVEGNFLGGSVLAAPSDASATGYQRPGALLVIVLNPLDKPLQTQVRVRLSEWLPATAGASWKLTAYDGEGARQVRPPLRDTDWKEELKLEALELKLFEFTTSRGPGR